MTTNTDDTDFLDPRLATCYADEFLDSLTELLRKHFDVDVAWIGEVSGLRRDRIRVLSGSATAEMTELSEYETCGAPCARVVEEGCNVVITRNALHDFPADPYFIENGISAYCAVPLVGTAGATIGLLGVCNRSEIANQDQVVRQLTLVAKRAAHEVETARTKMAIDSLSEIFRSRQSPDFLFQDLAAYFANAFRASIAVITEKRRDRKSSIQILAYVESPTPVGNSFGETLDVASTPCELVMREGHVVIEEDLQSQFPDFPAWSALQPVAYVGEALHSTDGDAIGYMALASDKRIPKETLNSPLWSIFKSQISVHIEKLKAGRERRRLDSIYFVNHRLRDQSFAASALGHDIGNLLTAVSVSADLCEMDLGDRAGTAQHLSAIRVATDEAAKLAAKLVGSVSSDTTNTNVAEFLTMLGPVLQSIGGDSATVDIQKIDPELTVLADQDELAQVFLNLVGNAVDACTGNDGSVTIVALEEADIDESSVLAGKLYAGTQYAYFRISDTGCGIDPRRLDSVFGRSSSTKTGGHGIGLLAVREIVNRHFGAISIVSETGSGTTVTVCWPTEAGKNLLRNDSCLGNWQGERSVMIVDDEPLIRSTLTSVLDKAGFEVILATGGEDAIGIARETPTLGALIIDIAMPGMDGWTLLSELRSFMPQRPTVMMSAYFPMKQVSVEAKQVTYLQKPFHVDSVYKSLESAAFQVYRS